MLLFLLPLVSVGQTPWPSADAEWNYITYWGWPPPLPSYTKYHVDGTVTVEGKVCTKVFADYYFQGNHTEGSAPIALLHFDGDTLWHYFSNTFYPLICFNASPGDTWHPLPTDSSYIDSLCTIMPIELLSTFTVSHNGQSYRGVTIGTQQPDGHLRWGGSFDERTFKNPDIETGYDLYRIRTLFPGYNICPDGGVVDWNNNDLLCFSDSELSIIKDNIDSYNDEDDCEYPWNLVEVKERAFQFSIYPNPATDNLRIESQTPLAQVKLTDLAGRTSIHQTFRQAQGDASIDVSSLPSGIYLLEARTQDGRRSVQKVVVE